MKKLMLAWAAGLFFSAVTLTAAAAFDDAARVIGSSATGVPLASIGQGEDKGGGEGEGEDAGESGESGGAQDHDGGWTYYFKPFPPDNAIVKVKVEGESDYGTPDRDHKYQLDGHWDGSATNGVTVRLLYVTQGGYLFSEGCKSNVWETVITNNAQEVHPPEGVVAIRAQAKSGSTDYLMLKTALEAAKSRARIDLYDSVTLAEEITVTNSITLNLNAGTLTLGSALTNAFHFTGGATVSNGTITSSLTANVEDSVILRFTDCKATLRDLTVNGGGYASVVMHDSVTDGKRKDTVTCDGLTLTGNGCLLSLDHATTTLTNACSFTVDNALTSFGEHQAAIYSTDDGTVSIVGGTYVASTVLLSEDFGVFFKSDDVIIAAPEGYVWKNGRLVAGTQPDAVTPGVTSASYADACAATNAAAVINANKANCIIVPSGVEGAAQSAYLTKVAATVTSDNGVVVELTPAAAVAEQAVVDAAVTNETAVASLTGTDALATVTIATTTPGLYYWIDGGTDVNAVTNAGAGVLSTNGGAVELTKPTLDATKSRAFFRIAAGVAAPHPSDDD